MQRRAFLMGAAAVAALHNIELQHSHFASTATPYLREFRARIEKAKSRMTQIKVEFGQMNLSADPVPRYQAIDLTMRWVDHWRLSVARA